MLNRYGFVSKLPTGCQHQIYCNFNFVSCLHYKKKKKKQKDRSGSNFLESESDVV